MTTPIKRKHAVALQYAKGELAPTIVATGAGELARRIVELARDHNVPVRADDSLTEVLSKLDIGHEIPPETYRAVAEILSFLYRSDAEWRRSRENSGAISSNARNLVGASSS